MDKTQGQHSEERSASQGAFDSPHVVAMLRSTAERLRQLRAERALRLTDVSAISGISEAHLSRIEAAERWPSLPALLTLADVYGIDPSTLLEGRLSALPVARHDARAVWEGSQDTGSGFMTSNGVRVAYDEDSRLSSTDERAGTADGRLGSPEELIGMAFAGCFSMSLAEALSKAGFRPRRIETNADVRLGTSGERISITTIHLVCAADVPGIDEPRFQEFAHITKRSCVVSRALAAAPVTLDAQLAASGQCLSTNQEE